MDVNTAIWAAGLIGFIVSAVELLARYRDDPLRALWSWPALSYALINGGAGLLAAWWLATFSKSLVAVDPVAHPIAVDGVKLTIVAGFGSLAVLRTSLMKLRTVGGDDISVGPAVIVDQLLSVVDRGVDRHLAEHRSQIAAQLASQIDFVQQSSSLVALCLVLLQNPSPIEAQQMTTVRSALAGRTDMPDSIKNMSLVLALLGLVGQKVLAEAVKCVQTGTGAPAPKPPP